MPKFEMLRDKFDHPSVSITMCAFNEDLRERLVKAINDTVSQFDKERNEITLNGEKMPLCPHCKRPLLGPGTLIGIEFYEDFVRPGAVCIGRCGPCVGM